MRTCHTRAVYLLVFACSCLLLLQVQWSYRSIEVPLASEALPPPTITHKLRWTSSSLSFELVSAGLDSRTIVPVQYPMEQDMPNWRPQPWLRPELMTFASLASDPRLHIFQVQLAISRKHYRYLIGGSQFKATSEMEFPSEKLISSVELVLKSPEVTNNSTTTVAAAHECVPVLAVSTTPRYNRGYQFIDFMVRCAFLLDADHLATLFDSELGRSRVDAWLVVRAFNQSQELPLGDVLHFPRPKPVLAPYQVQRPPGGYPSAPWHIHREGVEQGLVRARDGGEASRIRVLATCLKKWTWSEDDELWLLWHLDLVGVDHVAIGIASWELDLAFVRERLALYPGLEERVTLVDIQIPANYSYDYLLAAAAWDHLVRWQADFDYSFVIDSDEFVQLFESGPPYFRLDAKTFIARHRTTIEREGAVYFPRSQIQRSAAHDASEPVMGTLLARLALHNGPSLNKAIQPAWTERVGKSLVWLRAALHLHSHYSVFSAQRVWNRADIVGLHFRVGESPVTLKDLTNKLAASALP